MGTSAGDEFAPYRDRVARALAGVELADAAAVLGAFDAAGLGDGLPVVAARRGAVTTMLEGRNPEALAIGAPLPISFATPTWGDVATAAVLAGCPVGTVELIATSLDAVADPSFNLLGVQATTGSAAPLLIVHGDAVDRFGLHAGANAIGGGFRANVTIGRAVRLLLADLGVCRPGEADMATHGQPGKLSWLVAENQPDSPWPSFGAQRGAEPATRAGVTVFAGVGTTEVVLPSTTADELVALLTRIVRGLACPSAVLLLPPESARFLARNGGDRAALVAALQAAGAADPLVVVSGGTGVKATLVPRWGGPSEAVTRWLEPGGVP